MPYTMLLSVVLVVFLIAGSYDKSINQKLKEMDNKLDTIVSLQQSNVIAAVNQQKEVF